VRLKWETRLEAGPFHFPPASSRDPRSSNCTSRSVQTASRSPNINRSEQIDFTMFSQRMWAAGCSRGKFSITSAAVLTD